MTTMLAKDGGPKIRTTPFPPIGKRFGKEELQQLKEALAQNTLFYHFGQKTKQMCAKMAKLCDGPVIFHNLDVLWEDTGDGADHG